jgi:site-specific DNA-cytosine methylase
VGGLDLGLSQAGPFRTRWYSEVHPAALRVLAAHFPQAAHLGSVLDLWWERLGNAVSPPVARRIGEGILAAEGVAA